MALECGDWAADAMLAPEGRWPASLGLLTRSCSLLTGPVVTAGGISRKLV